jgi:NADH-quinone oxidoreductase subunit G
MPILIIDNQKIEVPEGTKVIDAAERLGIMIPRFCYHSALGAVGACRLCAVKFVEGPVQGIEMSCMTDARDEMVVSTDDPEAMAFRRFIIECLMMSHPHDCPVCDEGGHCLLQDETVSGGHDIRRYKGKKRTFRDQYIGPFVQHEMNRCIHCYLCVRFYQEFAGYRDLAAYQIGYRVYFGRFEPGQLESPFSGNLIDICPTGVFTDKPARYRGRRWNMERSPSVCIHCSLGCNTVANARYREVLRQEARLSETVNGHFICDRGRFGFGYANLPNRPRRARIGNEEVSWTEAIRALANRLTISDGTIQLKRAAVLGSARSSLETQAALAILAQSAGWHSLSFFADPDQARTCRAAVRRLDSKLAVSMKEIERADWILAVGTDPINEAPMLALAMRQAVRNGARVGVIDPRPVSLPFDFIHLPVSRGRMEPSCLNHLIRSGIFQNEADDAGNAVSESYAQLPEDFEFGESIREEMSALAEELKSSNHPVIICGTDIVPRSTPDLAADHARMLKAIKKQAGLFYILPGANAFGAALLENSAESSFEDTLDAIEAGEVTALLVVENDLLGTYPNRKRLEAALNRLEMLIVLDYLPTPTAERADMFLPTTTVFETGSCFINQEGRLQYAEQAHAVGTPIRQLRGKSHPPRVHREEVPGGDPRPAWRAIADLVRAMELDQIPLTTSGPETWLTGSRGPFPFFQEMIYPPRDGRILPAESDITPFNSKIMKTDSDPEAKAKVEAMDLLFVDRTFGTEALSAYSEPIRLAEGSPAAFIHPDDASQLGLKNGDSAILQFEGEDLEIPVLLRINMARGLLVIPRRPDLPWQTADGCFSKIPRNRIAKAGKGSE